MATVATPPLQEMISSAALAFRGYNITNLGRTRELLAIPAYRATLVEELRRYSEVCADVIKAPVDLAKHVDEGREYGLDQYAQAVALVVAIEMAQLRLLREQHDVNYLPARLAYGYSLGELSALCCCGAFAAEELVRVPLEMAHDCAALAHDATLAVLFSRQKTISEEPIRRLCSRITAQRAGTIGISAVLSPNTYLLIGQRESVHVFKSAMAKELPGAHVRLNDHRWPPLHTPIVRQRHVPDRAAVLLEGVACGPFPAQPAVLSLATGKCNYDEHNARELLRKWVDHPQRLWDAVCETLAAHVRTVVHVGPEPNVIPATFSRLGENVRQQMGRRSLGSYGKRAITGIARHPWLAPLLPARTALLRAPFIQQVVLEDWLIEHAPR